MSGSLEHPSTQAEVMRALEALQQSLATGAVAEPARRFNTLVLQAREHFPGADTLRLIEPLNVGTSVPVIEVRLAMMRRTLETELASPEAVAAHRAADRRRWQRRDVAWPARLIMADGRVLHATAMDASRHGLRVVLDGDGPPLRPAPGNKCRVEIHLAGDDARCVRDAEICHVDPRGIGLVVTEPLPVALVPPEGETPGGSHAGRGIGRQLARALARVRAVLTATGLIG